LNLFLAVTGRRADGFHDLVSLVAPLDFGDTLRVTDGERLALECSDPEVPCDGTNLVLKAARAFGAATRRDIRATFQLEKKIPLGAGLGGGSSDGVAALRGLNQLAGEPLNRDELATVAAQLGSDCPLFLHEGPVVIRGRGERVAPVSPVVAARLRGRRVVIFKPGFPVATAWAYARMVEQPDTYLQPAEAEGRLSAWMDDPGRPLEEILFNNMEHEVFKKYLALPALLARLRADFGVVGRMSGSGSACFAFLPPHVPAAPVVAAIRADWGDAAFVIESHLG
jgi:4-diphosphocytidyl-2-C-methyl-D-erythritol kinase